MRGAECVVDIRVRKLCKLFGEVGVVLLLAGVEAQIFEREHFAGLQGGGELLRAFPARHLGERHRTAEQLFQPLSDRTQRERWVGAFLRPAKVGTHDQARPSIQQRLEGGKRGAHTRVVLDLAVLDRNVEVNPHQHSASGHRKLIQRS